MSDDKMWERFSAAYRRICSARIIAEKVGSEHALARADGYIGAMEELQDAFRHMHVASDDGDKCGLCGLDLREAIHRRER